MTLSFWPKLIPLIPLIKKNLINLNNIIIDSKSGYSGAGRGVHKTHKDKNLYESLSAYGVGNHRHNSEIEQELAKYSKTKISFSFLDKRSEETDCSLGVFFFIKFL